MHESTFDRAINQFMQALSAEKGCLRDMEKSQDPLESSWAHERLDALYIVELALKHYNEVNEES